MLTITKDINKADFVTHAGNFHADDVFSAAFLEKLYDNITLIRLKEYNDDNSKIAFDIGEGKFDHHGSKYDKKRANGIHYCSFGLLWQEYGLTYLKKLNISDREDCFKIIDYLLVNQIDAIDNGEFNLISEFNIYTLSDIIDLYRPENSKDEDEAFKKATLFASSIIDLVIKSALNKIKAINTIKPLIPSIENKTLILDKFIPYEFAIFYLNLDINYVIYPGTRDCFVCHTVPTIYKGFTPKKPFNKSWAGLRDEELQKVSGIKTARFCHKNLFLFTADTLEDVLKSTLLS